MEHREIRKHAEMLRRRGWLESSLLIEGGEEAEPDIDSLALALARFFDAHREIADLAITAVGCRAFPDSRVLIVLYRPLGWERDTRELYDTIEVRGEETRFVAQGQFLRKVGAELSPTLENLHRLQRLHGLCERRARAFYFNLPEDEQRLFDEYLEVLTRRHPAEKESELFQNPIGQCLATKVVEDFFRLAWLTGREDLIEEEWRRCRQLPPEQYRDELFMRFYARCGNIDGCNGILEDLWQRGESWALYRLADRLRKGYFKGDHGEKLKAVLARLLASGQKVAGEWSREEMRELVELSGEELPGRLFCPAERAAV